MNKSSVLVPQPDCFGFLLLTSAWLKGFDGEHLSESLHLDSTRPFLDIKPFRSKAKPMSVDDGLILIV